MRLKDAVLKPSLGRLHLHHLASTYFVEVNEATVEAIMRALPDPEAAPQRIRPLVEKLRAAGLLEDGAPTPLQRREGSDVVSLEVEPIGKCNLSCRHCFVSFSGQRMTAETFDALLEGAARLGAVELTFNGGEPLLHPDCLAWMARSRAAGLRTLLFTNGTLVTERAAARLAEIGVARVTVSVDGFEAEHDALRGAGAFRRTVAGLERLVKAGLTVFTTTVVHDGNRAQVEALGRWCRETLGVHGLRTSTIAPMGRAAAAPELQLAPAEFQALYAAERRGAASDVASPASARSVGAGAGAAAPPTHGPGPLPCRAGIDKLYVAAGGAVYPCHLFESPGVRLGELPGRALVDVVEDVARGAWASLLCGFSTASLRACAGCAVLARCRGGCRPRAWTLTGDPLGPDPVSCRKYGVTPPAAARAVA